MKSFKRMKKIKNSNKVRIPKVTEEILEPYFEDINRYGLLSREEEDRLARLMVNGDMEARDQLIRSNLKFVVSIAHKYTSKGLSLADLINEGNTGLIMACKNYDPNRGLHFISYAVWWIRQAMAKAVAEQVKIIRLPLNRYLQLFKMKSLESQFENETTEQQVVKLAKILGEEESAIRDILYADKNHLSLDAKITNDAKSISLEETLVDTRIQSPEDSFDEKDMKKNIQDALQALSEREQKVIKMRFGLDGQKPLSLNEIGKLFHITKERVRQLEKRAIQKLRESPNSFILKGYMAA